LLEICFRTKIPEFSPNSFLLFNQEKPELF